MNAPKLSRAEKETAIVFNEESDSATIETYNRRLIKRLDELCKKHSGFYAIETGTELCAYEVPKKYIWIAKPRKKSDYQKTLAGVHGARALKLHREKQKNAEN